MKRQSNLSRLVRSRAALAVAALALGFAALPLRAQEYCVACTEPDAQYRCVIDNARPGGVASLQVLCITTLAKEAGHGSCTIARGTVFECKGPVRRVSAAAPAGEPAAGAPPVQGAQAPSPQPTAQGEPTTVVEAVKRANAATEAQLKKTGETMKRSTEAAGNAVAKATSTTWTCITSLFTRCSAQ